MRVAIVGAGIGGLAAAIRLAAAGHAVTVFERNPVIGGKLACYERDGFRFETGPSLLTLPAVFDDLLALAGMRLPGVVPLDTACAYQFSDGRGFRTRRTLDETVAEVEAFSPGSGGAWRAFHERGRRVWNVSERTFFAGPMDSPVTLLRRMRSPRDLAAVDPLPSLAQRAARSFTDPRLRQWAERYATYAGSSPYRAPATLACIPFIEQEHGCWYLAGGLPTLATALGEAAAKLGVEIRTGADVARLSVRGGRVTGVELATGLIEPADVVVSDADAHHVYRDLLPHPGRLRRVRRAGQSSSAFVLLLALDGHTPGISHHNVSFSADYRREFAEIFDEAAPPADPTVYVCNASVTDPTAAPPGAEGWFVLVNVPSAGPADWTRDGPTYRDKILDVLATRGWEVRPRMRWCEVITPTDIEARYRAVGGAIYGSSSNGRRSAFLRASNRGPVAGLYLVGGSAHPGGGLPLVALGGRIVAEMIATDAATTTPRSGP
ncbi:MAG: phytoene desaturase family protein [Acidimicrobiales bacterium]